MMVGGEVQAEGNKEEKKWDNCNSMIDKIYLKTRKFGDHLKICHLFINILIWAINILFCSDQWEKVKMLSEIIFIDNSCKIVFSNQIYELTNRVFYIRKLYPISLKSNKCPSNCLHEVVPFQTHGSQSSASVKIPSDFYWFSKEDSALINYNFVHILFFYYIERIAGG